MSLAAAASATWPIIGSLASTKKWSKLSTSRLGKKGVRKTSLNHSTSTLRLAGWPITSSAPGRRRAGSSSKTGPVCAAATVIRLNAALLFVLAPRGVNDPSGSSIAGGHPQDQCLAADAQIQWYYSIAEASCGCQSPMPDAGSDASTEPGRGAGRLGGGARLYPRRPVRHLYQISLIMTHRYGFPRLSARSAWRSDAGHRKPCAPSTSIGPPESLGKPPFRSGRRTGSGRIGAGVGKP